MSEFSAESEKRRGEECPSSSPGEEDPEKRGRLASCSFGEAMVDSVDGCADGPAD